jgi:hypothetical protein
MTSGTAPEGAIETITERELEEYFQRRQSERNVMGGASLEAARIVRDIKAHREPRYEPDAMYRDADGTNWLYAPGLAEAREGSWADCPWLKPGDKGAYSLNSPARPLRKLIPEGSQAAKADHGRIFEELQNSGLLRSQAVDLAQRICKLLGGECSSD